MTPSPTGDTRATLLDTAQSLVQERGFNAFSYKDLAAAVGIRTASIHYHFETKAALGKALMARYLEELRAALKAIDSKGGKNKTKLKRFIELYRSTQERGVICLCGSLASDLQTLPEELQGEVARYLDESELWVTETIRAGVRDGEFAPSTTAPGLASTLLAGLQGGLILARAQGESAPILKSIESSFFAALKKP